MFKHKHYQVAWICALPIEMASAKAMLDERHPPLPNCPGDNNSYEFGRIGQHNVLIAGLPVGQFSTSSAALVASEIRQSFGVVRIALLVGIGGGIPSRENDIRLGDIVVSKPSRGTGGVIQYDFGKSLADGKFEVTGSFNAPPKLLLTALTRLQARGESHEHEFVRHLLPVPLTTVQPEYKYPGQILDKLFETNYRHKNEEDGSNAACQNCLSAFLVRRPERKSTDPKVHYGIIGSGGSVVSDVDMRERLREQFGILCVETEAAGLMNDFPCLVIRGVSDYADSHKNKVWYRYAALTAAALAKELLHIIPKEEIPPLLPIAAPSPSDSFLVFTSHPIINQGVGLGWLVCDPCIPWDEFHPLHDSLRESDVVATPQRLVTELLDRTRGTNVNEKLTASLEASIIEKVDLQSQTVTETSYFLLNSGKYFEGICALPTVREFCERSLMYQFSIYMVVALRTLQVQTSEKDESIKDNALDLQTGCIGLEAQVVAIQYRKVGCKTTLKEKDKLYLEVGSNIWVHSKSRTTEGKVEVVEGHLEEKVSHEQISVDFNVELVDDQLVVFG